MVFVMINWDEAGQWVEVYTFQGLVEEELLKGVITGGFLKEPVPVELERF
ncbi:MAG: hypothetical protein ABIN58_08755 [candidate division WOR-3 bacterium]